MQAKNLQRLAALEGSGQEHKRGRLLICCLEGTEAADRCQDAMYVVVQKSVLLVSVVRGTMSIRDGSQADGPLHLVSTFRNPPSAVVGQSRTKGRLAQMP